MVREFPVEQKSHLRRLSALIVGRLDPNSLSPETALELAALARQEGLAGILLWAVVKYGGHPQDLAWAPAQVEARRIAAAHRILQSEHKRIQATLEGAHLPHLWLKGMLLAYSLYPSPELRPMSDLDVLVPRDYVRRALSVLNSLGYHSHQAEILPGLQDSLHAYPLIGGENSQVMVELHQHIVGSEGQFLSRAGLAWFWTQIHTYSWPDRTFTSLTREATFLHLCAHMILQHGDQRMPLRQVLDIHLALTEWQDLDWELVISQANRLQWGGAVQAALELAQAFFSTPLPEALSRRLLELPPSIQVAADPRHPQPLNRLEGTLRDLRHLSWSERFRLVWALLIPPRAYMQWRYPHRVDRWGAILYLIRWGDILLQVGDSVIKNFQRRISRNPKQGNDQ